MGTETKVETGRTTPPSFPSSPLPSLFLSLSGTTPYESHRSPVPLHSLPTTCSPAPRPLGSSPSSVPTRRRKARGSVLSLPFFPLPNSPAPRSHASPPLSLIPLPLLALEAAARQRSDPALLLLTSRQIRKQSVNSEGVKVER